MPAPGTKGKIPHNKYTVAGLRRTTAIVLEKTVRIKVATKEASTTLPFS